MGNRKREQFKKDQERDLDNLLDMKKQGALAIVALNTAVIFWAWAAISEDHIGPLGSLLLLAYSLFPIASNILLIWAAFYAVKELQLCVGRSDENDLSDVIRTHYERGELLLRASGIVCALSMVAGMLLLFSVVLLRCLGMFFLLLVFLWRYFCG